MLLGLGVRLRAGRKGNHVLKIYDEAWRIIGTEAQLDRMNADLRLSRLFGESNVIVMHALSDTDKVGHVGSAAVQKARGLLSLCDTRVILRQAPGELDRAVTDLGMTQAERDVVAGVGKGEALWKLPTRSFRVQTVLTAREKALFDTDTRMTTVDGATSDDQKLHRRAKAPWTSRRLPAAVIVLEPARRGAAGETRCARADRQWVGTVSSRAQLGGWGVLVGEAKIIPDDARVLDHAVVTGRAVISGAAVLPSPVGHRSSTRPPKISDQALDLRPSGDRKKQGP